MRNVLNPDADVWYTLGLLINVVSVKKIVCHRRRWTFELDVDGVHLNANRFSTNLLAVTCFQKQSEKHVRERYTPLNFTFM